MNASARETEIQEQEEET